MHILKRLEICFDVTFATKFERIQDASYEVVAIRVDKRNIN